MKEKNELKYLLVVLFKFAFAVFLLWFFIVYLDVIDSPFKTIIPYALICIFLLILFVIVKQPLIKQVIRVIAIVFLVPFIPAVLIVRYIGIVIAAFYYTVCAAIVPIALYKYLFTYFFTNNSTSLYLALSSLMFIGYFGNSCILFIIYRVLKVTRKYYMLKFGVLIRFFFQKRNVKGLIYLLYFILLLTSNIFSLEDKSIFKDINNEVIVMSLVTFIAFDRAYSILKDLKIKPSIILDKLKLPY